MLGRFSLFPDVALPLHGATTHEILSSLLSVEPLFPPTRNDPDASGSLSGRRTRFSSGPRLLISSTRLTKFAYPEGLPERHTRPSGVPLRPDCRLKVSWVVLVVDMKHIDSERFDDYRHVEVADEAWDTKAADPPVEASSRPRLPSLSSLALPVPGLPSCTTTAALTPPPTSRSASTSSPSLDPSRLCGQPPQPVPSREHSRVHLHRSGVQAAMYDALRRRWSASSASDLQALAEAAAEALRRKEGARDNVSPSLSFATASTNCDARRHLGGRAGGRSGSSNLAREAPRAKRTADALLEGDSEGEEPCFAPLRSSGMVIPCADADEARDQVSPLIPLAAKRRRAAGAQQNPAPSPRFVLDTHRSVILRAARQQKRTLSLDTDARPTGVPSIPSRQTAFVNLLNSLAAVQSARSSLSGSFPRTGPLDFL